ncbi:formyltransferase family protein [Rhodoplanes sp. Z2-YC6860]|uniref:formyltransferase family protein n=1 Tax=Rhodoplanes sp. Z2-YC6860 TaxID=674703 RepID=UPI0012ED6800|nr:formyltransferase family protein [Rhodoplanes sp. Z2-YC6860]
MPYWLRELSGLDAEMVVILDEKALADADVERFRERTEGAFPRVSMYNYSEWPFYLVPNHNGLETVAIVKNLGLDLLLNCGTPRIIKSPLLKAPRIGVLNCHPGKLPDYRGCTVVEWALFNGDQVSNTAHLMTEEIDLGPIVVTETVNLKPDDSYVNIRVKVYKANIALLAKAVGMLIVDGSNFSSPSGAGKYWKPIDDERLKLLKSWPIKGQYG